VVRALVVTILILFTSTIIFTPVMYGGEKPSCPLFSSPVIVKEYVDIEGWTGLIKSNELILIHQVPRYIMGKSVEEYENTFSNLVFWRVTDLGFEEKFLKAAEPESYDDFTFYKVLAQYVKGENCKYYEVINGEIASIIEPLPLTIVKIRISGSVPPGYGYWRGPFGPSIFRIAVYLEYTPTDHIVIVGLKDYYTHELIDAQMLTDGSGWAIFNTDQNRVYAVGIINPLNGNTQTITYSGIIYLYYI
jgi:hypothetical protein